MIVILKQYQQRFLKAVCLLFQKNTGETDEERRCNRRIHDATLTTLVMTISRLVNISMGLLTIPLTIHYLGEELFGAWMVLTSFVGILSFYDFGIGVGLRNELIKCYASENRELAGQYVFNALVTLIFLAFILIVLAFCISPFLPLDKLIKCSNPETAKQVAYTATAMVIIFALGLPLNQILNICSAYQKAYIGYFFMLVGRILAFLFILLCVWCKWPFIILASGYLLLPSLLLIIAYVLYRRRNPWLFPLKEHLKWKLQKRLFSTGGYVMIHHLSYAMIYSSIILIIGNVIGAIPAGQYSIIQKLFSVTTIMGTSLLMGISLPLGEAWHKREIPWIRKTLRQTWKVIGVTCILPLIAVIPMTGFLIKYWTGKENMIPSSALVLACALVVGISLLGDIYANSLMAMDYVKIIALTRFCSGVLTLLGGYYIGKYTTSITILIFWQFLIGVLIPAIIFFCNMDRILKKAHSPSTETAG